MTFHRMSSIKHFPAIVVGQTDTGLASPAVNAAITFFQITLRLLIYFPNETTMLYPALLNEWLDILIGKYQSMSENEPI